jgi:ribose transport system substrate-binding protein
VRTHSRWIAALTAAILALGVAACGSDDDDGTTTAAKSDAKKSYDIALITNDEFDPFYMTMNAGAQDAAKELGVKVSWSAPKTPDLPSQTAILQSVMARKPDAVLMSAVDSRGMVAPIRQLQAQKIPVILLDADVSDPSVRLAFIGSDNKAAGKLAAKTMNELLGGNGKVAYEGYVPGIQSVDARRDGWKEGLKEFPGLKDGGDTYDKGDLKDVAANVNALMKRNPDLAGIFASWTNPVIGAGNAIQNANKAGKVKLVGLDASPDEVSLLRRGVVSALIVQKVYDVGRKGVEDIVKYLNDGTKPSDTLLDAVVATKENMDSPEIKKYLYRTGK